MSLAAWITFACLYYSTLRSWSLCRQRQCQSPDTQIISPSTEWGLSGGGGAVEWVPTPSRSSAPGGRENSGASTPWATEQPLLFIHSPDNSKLCEVKWEPSAGFWIKNYQKNERHIICSDTLEFQAWAGRNNIFRTDRNLERRPWGLPRFCRGIINEDVLSPTWPRLFKRAGNKHPPPPAPAPVPCPLCTGQQLDSSHTWRPRK